jgi:predicted ribosomally synthesized peptide with SipW-like signal peptide
VKRTWLLAIMAAVLVAAVVSGVTLALFSASTSPQQSQLTAGTLQITGDRDNGDQVPGPMFYIGPGGGLYETGLWAPGDEFHRVFQIENTGSLDAWLKHVRAALQSGSRPLADKLQVKVTADPGGLNVLAAGTLGQFIDGDMAFAGGPISADVGDVVDLHFWVSLPLNADNTYQNLSCVASFTVYAEQKAHNP